MLVMPLRRPDLKVSSPVPLYEQVVRHVTESAARGDIQPGERLPAVRDLAEDWDIGGNTITHAWAILQERGILVSTHGKGTFVAEQQPGEPTGQ